MFYLKPLILCMFILCMVTEAMNLKTILLHNKWKVAYTKTQKHTDVVILNAKDATVDTASSSRGQLISFNVDHTVYVANKGSGLWSEIENYNWFIDAHNCLVFRNKGASFYNGFTLTPISFSSDSIILYIHYKGIESRNSKVVIYRLEKYK